MIALLEQDAAAAAFCSRAALFGCRSARFAGHTILLHDYGHRSAGHGSPESGGTARSTAVAQPLS